MRQYNAYSVKYISFLFGLFSFVYYVVLMSTGSNFVHGTYPYKFMFIFMLALFFVQCVFFGICILPIKIKVRLFRDVDSVESFGRIITAILTFVSGVNAFMYIGIDVISDFFTGNIESINLYISFLLMFAFYMTLYIIERLKCNKTFLYIVGGASIFFEIYNIFCGNYTFLNSYLMVFNICSFMLYESYFDSIASSLYFKPLNKTEEIDGKTYDIRLYSIFAQLKDGKISVLYKNVYTDKYYSEIYGLNDSLKSIELDDKLQVALLHFEVMSSKYENGYY